MKVVRLSALRTGCLYPQEIYLVLIYVRGCQPQGHSAAGMIVSMKNSNDTIEPATFRLVAQCLNQLRRRVPPTKKQERSEMRVVISHACLVLCIS
jgi:hypothetical protein